MASKIRNIGVIGAGQMGNGIVHVCALAGYSVLLNDIAPDRIHAGLATINGNLARQVSRGAITEEQRKDALERIKVAEAIDDLADCDLVVEAATEKEDVKRKVFAALCASLKPDAIIGTNTSSIPITRLAAATDRPEKFIGIHFMNPVPLMELVELIRGINTDDATFDTVRDFIGLDTCLSVMQVLHEGLADSKYRPCPLLVKYVEAGWLGRKTQRGFYDYRGDKPVPTR